MADGDTSRLFADHAGRGAHIPETHSQTLTDDGLLIISDDGESGAYIMCFVTDAVEVRQP
jgi:hypothetical protein